MKNGFPAPNKELQQTKNDHLTGKAPYKFGQAIVGNSEGTGLRRGEVIETERRHLGPAERTTGHGRPVTRPTTFFSRSIRTGTLKPKAWHAVADPSKLLLL